MPLYTKIAIFQIQSLPSVAPTSRQKVTNIKIKVLENNNKWQNVKSLTENITTSFQQNFGCSNMYR